MQNDMLKNNIAPWQEKGRWYHGIIDGNTNTIDADNTDKLIVDNGTVGTASGICYLYLGKGNIPIQHVVKAKDVTVTSGTNTSAGKRYAPSGDQGILLGPANTGTYEFWVFIVTE